MNYSDENTQGLMSLLAASQNHLDPTTAYGMMQDIQANQQAQNEQRQARQSGLLGMLQELAMGGMPYAGAEAMLDAAPGPMGPALQRGLQSLYPEGGLPPTNASGAVMDFPAGSRAIDPSTGEMNPYAGQESLSGGGFGPTPMPQPTGPDALSPAFQPEPLSFTEQQAQMEMAQQETLSTDLALLQQDAAASRANQLTVDEFIAESMKENADLWARAPEEAMQIVENTYGSVAVDTRGMPQIG